MKQGTLGRILAVEIVCPCGGICDNQARGSSMIEEGDGVLICEDCNAEVRIPADAFRVARQRKPKTIQ